MSEPKYKIARASDMNRAFAKLYNAVGATIGVPVGVPHIFAPFTPVVGDHLMENITHAADLLEVSHKR